MKLSNKRDIGYRPEIDGLRAIAVLGVIVFHFFEHLAPSGYLGVDVFFVISGYVITSHLIKADKRSPLNFLVSFVARRIRRLLPALVLCVTMTAIVFLGVVTRPPKEVFATGAFALFGLGNIQLWLQSQDYFAIDARLNPFTHTWSLGVEEQFYLVYPFFFLIFGYRWQRCLPTPARFSRTLIAIALASLSAYFLFAWLSPRSAFYLMPARLWEFAAGALAFLYLRNTSGGSSYIGWHFQPTAAAISAVVMSGCLFLPSDWSVATIPMIVLATSVLLISLTPRTRLHDILCRPSLVGIGRISYSLYLWHWSLLIVGKWTIGTSIAAKVILLGAAFALAALSYRFVEEPIRRAHWLNPLTVIGLSLVAIMPLFYSTQHMMPQWGASYNTSLPSLLGIDPPAPFPDVPCSGRAKISRIAQPLETCLAPARTVGQPHRITMLGDSHAAQLYPMVEEAVRDLPFSVAFMNPEDTKEFPYGFMNGRTQSPMLDFVSSNIQKGDVIIIAFHRGHFRLDGRRDHHVAQGENDASNARSSAFTFGLEPYLTTWQEHGALVILVSDTPLMRVISTSSACLLQIRLFGESVCRVTRDQDMRTRALQDATFAILAGHSPAVSTWDPAPLIYKGASSMDVVDEQGQYLMWDWNHISEYQARQLAPAFRLFLKQLPNSSNVIDRVD